MKQIWVVKDLLTWITNKFQAEGFSTPLLDAQLLLCSALKYHNRVELYLNSEKIVKDKELIKLRELIKRRLSHEPVAYILNQKYWCDLDLFIDSNVLIPRPETESLLDLVIETTKQKHMEPKVVFDLATGSGCLAIALAKQFPDAHVIGVDISNEALNVAKKNALRNHVLNIEFVEANLLEDETFLHLKKQFGHADLILANPPYISLDEWETLPSEVKNFEPTHALIANNHGLEIGKNIFLKIQLFDVLSKCSVFAMELSHKQPEILLNESSCKEKTLLPLNAQEHEKPVNNWFILKDLEDKERFLIKICQHENE